MANTLLRTNSICPSDEVLLLDGVKKNNLELVDNLLSTNKKLLTHQYPEEENKTILLVACSDVDVSSKCLEIILNNGADVSARCSSNYDYTAIHFLVYNQQIDHLKVLLRKHPKTINSLAKYSNNALHVLIKETDYDSSAFLPCAELLLKSGINVNQTDDNGKPAIVYAARKKYKELVKLLIEFPYQGHKIDLSNNIKVGRVPLREYLVQNDLLADQNQFDQDTNPSFNEGSEEMLYDLIKSYRENDFTKQNVKDFANKINSPYSNSTLLQLSCEKGLKSAVQHLIDNGSDVTLVSNDKRSSLEIASEKGISKIFEMLLNHWNENTEIPGNVLVNLLRNMDNMVTEDINHAECFDILMKILKQRNLILDLNYKSELDDSVMHYAVKYGKTAQILQLLDLGASICTKNAYGFMPIKYIDSKVLETHLDKCIVYDSSKKDLENDQYIVSYNVQSFLPPSNRNANSTVINMSDKDDKEIKTDEDYNESTPETDVFLQMAYSKDLKSLLKHPVIVTFLLVKWHQLRWLFRLNVGFYVTFVLSLIFFTLYSYVNFGNNISTGDKAIGNLSYTILIITFILLLLRELFQMFISPNTYFKSFDNYLEIILLCLTTLIIFVDLPSQETKKQLTSITILLASFELVLLVGQHPKLSTNVEILRTVSITFFKLLLWYSILIVAFVISFYVLFAKSVPESEENNFSDAGKSFFKTIIMLTGEFDAGSIPFDTLLSKIIFCLFIFMITIILLNLLNGLAVSDTQMITSDAELVGHIARIKYINYIEEMVHGNIWPTFLVKRINSFFGCCTPFQYSIKPLPKTTCLLVKQFPNYRISVDLNNGGLIQKNTDRRHVSCRYCSNLCLDQETISRTRIVIQKRRDLQTDKICDKCMHIIKNVFNLL